MRCIEDHHAKNQISSFTKIESYNTICRRRQWHPTPVLLPGKSHGWRSLEGCSPWGRWASDTTEWLPFHFSLSCIGEGNDNPLQCSCLENPRDGGAWWAAVYGVTHSRTRLKRLSSSSSNNTICLMNSGSFKSQARCHFPVTSLAPLHVTPSFSVPPLHLYTEGFVSLHVWYLSVFSEFLLGSTASGSLVDSPLLGSTRPGAEALTCWPVQHGYQVISIHTLNGFGIGKYLFTYNTLLSIINGYLLGQVFSAIREGPTLQKLQVLRPALLSTKNSVSVSVLLCK